MNRRAFIAAAPAVALAGPGAAETETPIMRLFRQREAILKAANGYVCVTVDEDEEMEAVFWRRVDQINDEMMALPCTCAADFAAKVIVATAEGSVVLDWEVDPLWAEARALVA